MTISRSLREIEHDKLSLAYLLDCKVVGGYSLNFNCCKVVMIFSWKIVVNSPILFYFLFFYVFNIKVSSKILQIINICMICLTFQKLKSKK